MYAIGTLVNVGVVLQLVFIFFKLQTLMVAVRPLQLIADSPFVLARNIQSYFVSQESLQKEVKNLNQRLLVQSAQLQALASLNVENQNFLSLTRALIDKVVAQDAHSEVGQTAVLEITRKISNDRKQAQKETLERLQRLFEDMRRKLLTTQETGASNWLTSLPLRAKGFNLNKQEFVDAVALKHGWPIAALPSTCGCGKPNNVTHTMTCKKGGFICIRHDEVRDLTASMLREVCHDVTIEPALLPLEGEYLQYRTANTSNDSRVDVSARGFWMRGQKAFFDIRIFYPMADCHRELSLEAAHKKNEQEKMRAYGVRVQQVDQGSFTPLVFISSGGMGPKAKCFYSKLAEAISERKQQPRSHVVAWMRCRLSFSLLRSALLCLRGTRYSAQKPTNIANLDYEVAVAHSRISVLQE